MTKLIFATNNANKVEEIKSIIRSEHKVISLAEAGVVIDIPEPFDSLEENARQKSMTIYKLTGQNCFGEDTGLEVEALNGAPGVRSARYAGEGKSSSDNIEKLLLAMKSVSNREARFRTIISLVENGIERRFEGVCEGHIVYEPKGEKGFGYDSIFIPGGASKTFAEMTLKEKNKYSHRKKATALFLSYLSQRGKDLCQ